MKKLISFVICSSIFLTVAYAQTFTEDFESYSPDTYLSENSPSWKTKDNKPGTPSDVKITNSKAHGGSNAIYITTASPFGGPAAIGHLLQENYNTGILYFETWFYVESGKTAYMQFETKDGSDFAVNLLFSEDGSFKISPNNTLASGGTYQQDAWHRLNIELNLNTGTFIVLLDKTVKAHMQIPVHQMGAIWFYSYAKSSFYIDDLSYTYAPYSLTSVNIAPVRLEGIRTYLAGQTYKPVAVVRNLGKTSVQSFNIKLTYMGNEYTREVTGVNIDSLDTIFVEFPSEIALQAGQQNVLLSVSNVNVNLVDHVVEDDYLYIPIDPVVPAPDKTVIVEEGTGTWCGWCPRGIVYMAKLRKQYGHYFHGIAVHNGDPMVVDAYDSIFAGKIGGYPNVLVDRSVLTDPMEMQFDFLKRIAITPKAVIAPKADFNAADSTLKITLTTTFNSNVSGDYRIVCVLTQDSVTGETVQYRQANYYTGGGYGPMGGFENFPMYVPYSKIAYDDVARGIQPGYYGLENSFDPNITAGSSYTHNFTFDISGFNLNKLHIAAMLLAPDSTIDNGVAASYSQASGMEENTLSNSYAVYPNPANDLIYIQGIKGNTQASLFDLTGKVVLNAQLIFNATAQTIPINNLKDGVYILRLQDKDGIHATKVIVSK